MVKWLNRGIRRYREIWYYSIIIIIIISALEVLEPSNTLTTISSTPIQVAKIASDYVEIAIHDDDSRAAPDAIT